MPCLLLSLLLSTNVYAKNNQVILNQLSGYVLSGDTPISYGDVLLYQAGTQYRATGSKLLAKVTTNQNGYFQIAYYSGSDSGEVLYLTARGNTKGSWNSPIKLAAVLDSSNIPTEVYITPLSTVATAYAMAQYTDGLVIGGKNPGLKNASGTAQNLADLSNGQVAELLKKAPNGKFTSTLQIFNSLANMLDACIQDNNNCTALFSAAKPPRGREPNDTFAAMVFYCPKSWIASDSTI